MRARALPLLLSLSFHVVLLAAFALLAPPGELPAAGEPAVVRLRLPPPEPERSGLEATDSGTMEGSSSGAADERPSIRDQRASRTSTTPGQALPPSRMSGAAQPRASAASASAPAGPAAPVHQATTTLPATAGAALPPIAAPPVRPDPSELLRQMQLDSTRATADLPAPKGDQPEGKVEQEIGVTGRTLRSQPSLAFPSILLEEGREADVAVRIKILADGTVLPIEVTQSSGYSGVDSAVERIVRSYLFNSVGGGTIEQGTVTFHFRLKKGFG